MVKILNIIKNRQDKIKISKLIKMLNIYSHNKIFMEKKSNELMIGNYENGNLEEIEHLITYIDYEDLCNKINQSMNNENYIDDIIKVGNLKYSTPRWINVLKDTKTDDIEVKFRNINYDNKIIKAKLSFNVLCSSTDFLNEIKQNLVFKDSEVIIKDIANMNLTKLFFDNSKVYDYIRNEKFKILDKLISSLQVISRYENRLICEITNKEYKLEKDEDTIFLREYYEEREHKYKFIENKFYKVF